MVGLHHALQVIRAEATPNFVKRQERRDATRPAAAPYQPATRTGGTVTTSIGSAKGAVIAANQQGEAAVASVSAVIQSLEAQRAALLAAADGTNQQDAQQAAGQITRVIQHFQEGQSLASQAITMVADVAARL